MVGTMSGLGLKDKWRLFGLYRRRKEVFAKLGSRKLWAAVAGSALLALGTQLGLPEDTTQKIVELLMVYIVGQGVVDAAAAVKGEKK